MEERNAFSEKTAATIFWEHTKNELDRNGAVSYWGTSVCCGVHHQKKNKKGNKPLGNTFGKFSEMTATYFKF